MPEHSEQDTSEADQGLYQKYVVYQDGEPVPNCFVLEPESDPVALEAMEAYADVTDNQELADDLQEWVRGVRGRDE